LGLGPADIGIGCNCRTQRRRIAATDMDRGAERRGSIDAGQLLQLMRQSVGIGADSVEKLPLKMS
jgi:hypothetical protein